MTLTTMPMATRKEKGINLLARKIDQQLTKRPGRKKRCPSTKAQVVEDISIKWSAEDRKTMVPQIHLIPV